jgi:serine/threonine protein kinase
VPAALGDVYRAKDTQLKREVALEVLPEAFASDPERMAQSQREASAQPLTLIEYWTAGLRK